MTHPNHPIKDPAEREEAAELCHAVRQSARMAKKARTLIDVCREIKEKSQCMRHRGRLIDHFSACAYVVVYDALKPESRATLAEIAERDPVKAIGICFKLCK